MLSVEVRGLAETQATIRALPEASKEAGAKFARKAGVVIERFWKLHLSGPASGKRLGVRTGSLRSSIHHEQLSPGVVVVGSDKPYARIHELGGMTRPHVIRPRTAGVLAFFVGAGAIAGAAGRGAATGGLQRARLASGRIAFGQMAFARFVNHPGSKIPARPARQPAIEAAGPALEALAKGMVEEAVQAASRAAASIRGQQMADLASLRAQGLTGRRTGPIRVFRRG